jgi:hypothetical protein
LLIRNTRQERRKHALLIGGQCSQKRGLMLARDAADGLKHLFALCGQLQDVDAAILRVFEPLHESAFLELVDERHKPAREHAEPLRDVLLAGSGRGSDDAKRTHVRRSQAEGAETLGKLCRRVGPNLREKKRRPGTFPATRTLSSIP